jgi:tetratricopeptide (TPR) repeat protein
MEFIWHWNQDPQTADRAFALAQKALALDASLADPHQILGFVYLWRDKQHEQAIAALEQAIALDPNYADNYVVLADVLIFSGRPAEALEVAKKALRLDPHYPAAYLFELGWAYQWTDQYEEAIAAFQRALALNPEYLTAHLNLAVVYSELGREEEARAAVAAVQRINPHYTIEVGRQLWPFKDPADLERFITALRKAGLK